MAISLLIPIIVMAIIIIIIVVAASAGAKVGGKTGTQTEMKKGGEEMIKSVYVYLVLFATLMMSIGGSVSAFMSVADLVAPTPYYQSFEDFKRWGQDSKEEVGEETIEKTKPSEGELKERYDAMILREREREISRAKNSLIKSFGWIIIPSLIFIYFQRNLVKSKA